MFKILLSDDCFETHLLVQRALGSQYSIVWAKSAAETKSFLKQYHFDLLILDVALPDGDGFKLCAQARSEDETRRVPIVFLTGQTNIDSKVTGFSLGADDYIQKPFDPLELNVRIKARLNRVQMTIDGDSYLLKGLLKLDLFRRQVYLTEPSGNNEIDLKPTDYKLLFHLMRNEDRVLSREQLLNAVWGDCASVTDRTVDKHICSLRQKLGACGRYIQTVPSFGYRFLAR